MSEQALLEFRGLWKSYKEDSEAVVLFEDFSWTLGYGQAVAVVGESGTGKTTLLHLAATLERPDVGEIIVDGQPTSGLNEQELALIRSQKLGLVFQFHFLLKEFSVLENVALPAWLIGTPRAVAWDRARFLVDAVGLSSRAKSYPHQLSGGERQRAALARALVNDPSIILADEPTGNLDTRNSRMVQDLLLELVQKEKKSLLLVTHDLEFARRTGNVLRLSHGQLEPE